MPSTLAAKSRPAGHSAGPMVLALLASFALHLVWLAVRVPAPTPEGAPQETVVELSPVPAAAAPTSPAVVASRPTAAQPHRHGASGRAGSHNTHQKSTSLSL